MHSRLRVALVGGTTALLSVLAVSVPSIAVGDERPEATSSELLGIDRDSLGLPGARSSSTATTAATRTLTTNLPSLLRATSAHAQVSTAFTQSVAQHVGASASTDLQVTNLSAAASAVAQSAAEQPAASTTGPQPHGSVAETTEDGITIAALSEELSLPDDAPGVIGLVYDQRSDVEFEVRTKQDGQWSSWNHLHVEDAGEGTPGTEPYYVVGAESLQVRILGDDWNADGTRIILVDPKTHTSDAEAVHNNQPTTPSAGDPSDHQHDESHEPPAGGLVNGGVQAENVAYSPAAAGGSSTAESPFTVAGPSSAANMSASVKKVDRPTIRSRKDWGADGSLGSTDPAIAGKATAAVVHHTDGQNDYAAEDVPAILRGIHTFHVTGRGWDDVGYNMFADAYGRLWEGRAGGLDKAVVGAHAAGYNTGTFGISVLGSFGSKAPPQKTLDAVSGAIAWKLSLSGTSADAKTTVAGDSIRTVVGHRDVGQTSCPGAAFYEALGGIRSTAVDMQEGKRSVNPADDADAGADKQADDKQGGGGSGDDGLGAGVQDLLPGVQQD